MAIKPFNSINGFSVSGNGNVIIDSAGNITTDSIIVAQNANLGNIANVKIGGGSSGYVISTDGAGNLSFVAGGGGGGGSNIANGTSNVNIATSGGNVTTSVGGTSNVLVVTTTGANIAGTVSASGNITGNYFIGNGSQLTGIIASAGAAITNGNSNVTVVANSNITMTVSGTSNVVVVTTTGANINGALTTTGNVNVGNANAVTWANSAGPRVYTFYNDATASLDTVFI